MRLLNVMTLLFLFATVGCAQNEETHNGKVVGSFPLGNQEVTTIYDEVTNCERKTNPHTSGLFQVDEAVQIKLVEGSNIAEVLKEGMSERITTSKECNDSDQFNLKAQENDKVTVTCNGTCDCSLEGVLSGSNSFVQCTCNDCKMTVVVETQRNDNAEQKETILENLSKMKIETLEYYLEFIEEVGETKLTKIEMYRVPEGIAVQYFYSAGGEDETVMFTKANVDDVTYKIDCTGPCGCKEVWNFKKGQASCSCDDCVMTVEEVKK